MLTGGIVRNEKAQARKGRGALQTGADAKGELNLSGKKGDHLVGNGRNGKHRVSLQLNTKRGQKATKRRRKPDPRGVKNNLLEAKKKRKGSGTL